MRSTSAASSTCNSMTWCSGVALTEEGQLGALEVLRHHRLLERYLVDRLGLSIDEVHAEADRLEHALSEELEAKIDRFMAGRQA